MLWALQVMRAEECGELLCASRPSLGSRCTRLVTTLETCLTVIASLSAHNQAPKLGTIPLQGFLSLNCPSPITLRLVEGSKASLAETHSV